MAPISRHCASGSRTAGKPIGAPPAMRESRLSLTGIAPATCQKPISHGPPRQFSPSMECALSAIGTKSSCRSRCTLNAMDSRSNCAAHLISACAGISVCHNVSRCAPPSPPSQPNATPALPLPSPHAPFPSVKQACATYVAALPQPPKAWPCRLKSTCLAPAPPRPPWSKPACPVSGCPSLKPAALGERSLPKHAWNMLPGMPSCLIARPCA